MKIQKITREGMQRWHPTTRLNHFYVTFQNVLEMAGAPAALSEKNEGIEKHAQAQLNPRC